VFPVRYELDLYILFIRNSFFKELIRYPSALIISFGIIYFSYFELHSEC
jgi:hypothetical protein